MSHSPDLHILCMRHGRTDYTGIFPDLTHEGEAHIRRTADDIIMQWMRERHIRSDALEILSSPSPRAHGTAVVIAEALGCTIPVTIRSDIDAIAWKDRERCLAACKGLKGKGYINYETEPIFADPELFETPDEVRDRWYAFLAEYIGNRINSAVARSVVFVSHYEVLCNITRDIFGIVASEATALKHGEPIVLSVSLTSDPMYVLFSGTFRKQVVAALFDLSSHTIHVV